VEKIAENFDLVQLPVLGSKETHDQLTGKKDHFNVALKARISLMEYNLPTSAAVVANKLNLPDINDMMNIIAAMSMNSVLLNRFLPGGRGLDNTRSLILKEKEMIEFLNEVEKSAEEYGLTIFIGTPIPPCLEGLRSYKFLLKEGCVAGKDLHCTIDPSGGLRVCNHSPQVLGNCLEYNPKEIYEKSKYVKGFTELKYTPKMCKECEKLPKCKGGCREAAHVLLGSLTAPDPIFVI
jgi:radical SAM protein with 4Fe4S-binding SPASM domain